nr:hypothetical protein CFP56_70392 [Quercus suber]
MIFDSSSQKGLSGAVHERVCVFMARVLTIVTCIGRTMNGQVPHAMSIAVHIAADTRAGRTQDSDAKLGGKMRMTGKTRIGVYRAVLHDRAWKLISVQKGSTERWKLCSASRPNIESNTKSQVMYAMAITSSVAVDSVLRAPYGSLIMDDIM